MAVVQISKIQVRRGLKNSGIGVPQLSSAEFAWAVDSQELFIGNGSVAEGAPFVGNTKILTERDNILELASGYRFSNNDPAISFAVSRTLQSKLDEYVSILDFGAVPDGITDNVEAFNRAFEQLFRSDINTDSKYKKILFIPNGIYKFNSNLRIPGTAKIKGENENYTVLKFDTNNILLTSQVGTDVNGFTSTDKPTDISIEKVMFELTTGRIDLSGLEDGLFREVIFKSNFNPLLPVESLDLRPSMIFWNNTLIGTRADNIKFEKCIFKEAKLAVKCVQENSFETSIDFLDCTFSKLDVGIYINGVLDQINNWFVDKCSFDEVYRHSIYTNNGTGFTVENSSFRNCGNGLNGPSSPVHTIVFFGQPTNNKAVNISSDRHQASSIVSDELVPAVIEIDGANSVNLIDRNFSSLFLSDGFRPLAIFPSKYKFIELDYTITIGDQNRYGRLTLTTDVSKTTVNIADHYSYSALFLTSPGGPTMTNFDFTATLRDNDSDSGVETIVLFYRNPLLTGSIGSITYSISYGV